MSNLHKKFKSNEHGEVGFVPIILMFCVLVLLIQSVIITWFSTQWYGSSSINSLPMPTGIQTFSSKQDFSTCSLNTSTWLVTGTSSWLNYCENGISGVGVTLVRLDYQGGRAYSWLLLNNIIPDGSGSITNTYQINNSVGLSSGAPYVIALRYTGGLDQIELRVDDDGFHIPNYIIPPILNRPLQALSDQYFQPSNYPDRISNPTITTVYNTNANTLTFTFNGQSYSTSGLKQDANLFGLFGRYYGGVGSNYIGFTLSSLTTSNNIVLNNSGSALNQILNFISVLSSMVLFSIPTTLLPTELSFFTVRLPEFGIILCSIILIFEALL
jgi:hypothetical protein